MVDISVLCTTTNSVYEKLGLDCYDQKRNARTFTAENPVIAHPPCRGYSAFMRHWAKPRPGEKDLALFCAEQIARFGGVLEHPAYSRFVSLFKHSDKWKIETVYQEWFDYPIRKATWLLMPSHYVLPELPFRLEPDWIPGEQKRIFENMSHKQRHETTESFAKWLIELVKINE